MKNKTNMSTGEYHFSGEYSLPTQPEALQRPERLSKSGKLAHEVIMSVLIKNEGINNPCGCKTFYAPKAWQERGEEYGHTSELIVVYDGGDIGLYFDYDKAFEMPHLREEMETALNNAGFYYEPATCWYGCVYKV